MYHWWSTSQIICATYLSFTIFRKIKLFFYFYVCFCAFVTFVLRCLQANLAWVQYNENIGEEYRRSFWRREYRRDSVVWDHFYSYDSTYTSIRLNLNDSWQDECRSSTFAEHSRVSKSMKQAELDILLLERMIKPLHSAYFKYIQDLYLRSSPSPFSKSERKEIVFACQDGIINTLVCRDRILHICT